MEHLYKDKLRNYALNRNLTLPTYSCKREGHTRASRFKCTITFDRRTYETQEFSTTLKEVEHRAAKVVLMSLSPDGIQEDDDSGLYKNLLQRLAQKNGYALPVYITTKSDVPHIPTFISTMEVEQETFLGQEAKTKKLAEMSAAKAAYMTLKEPNSNIGLPDPKDTRTRLRVCTHVPNMKVPEGSEVMHSDDNWVALKLTS